MLNSVLNIKVYTLLVELYFPNKYMTNLFIEQQRPLPHTSAH